MSLLKRVESELEERLRRLFAPPEGEGRELLEIQRGILEEVVSKAQKLPRGKLTFPYNELSVSIPVVEPERRPLFEMVFVEEDQLARDIRETLVQAGCTPPAKLTVDVRLAVAAMPEASAKGFHIVYRRNEAPARRPTPHGSIFAKKAGARLVVMQGKATQESYQLTKSRVHVGRLAEVLDDQHRLVRLNDIVFSDRDHPANGTVSRKHAHLRYDGASGEFRLFDDYSAYGTSVFRDGELMTIPSGGGRGVALRAGDEIYFGQARVRFEAE